MNVSRVIDAAGSRMDDLFDGYVLVAFVAGTNEPVIVRKHPDAKTKLALDVLLSAAMQGGGIVNPPCGNHDGNPAY